MRELHSREGRENEIWVCHLGVVPYPAALAAQERMRDLRREGEIADSLLLLEHPRVYTRGRRSGAGDLPLGEDFYRSRGIDVIDVDRGGRVTYHEPGQLVGYPIMEVRDVARHVRTMEASLIDAIAQEGIDARARTAEGPDYTGVWVQDRKIGSIGVHIRGGVSTHGFSLNVWNDLEMTGWIVACGLPDAAATSVERESRAAAGCEERMRCVRRRVAHSFCSAHSRRQRLVSPRALGIDGILAGSGKALTGAAA